MSTIVAMLLGVIQGLTEFIPISSTAHLTIAATWLNVIDPAHPERWTAFMATIQLGTLAAVIAYFRRDITHMTTAFLRENLGSGRRAFREQSGDARMAWLVVIATLPIVVVGLTLKDVIEGPLTKDLSVIAGGLIGVALLLWWADSRATFTKTSSQITVKDSFLIGLAQCLALIPGSSRSGTTIFAGLFRGLTREHAARFSFLMSIPAILGAGILEFIGELDHLSWNDGGMELLVATIAAAVSGYWSIAFLLRYLRTHSLRVFILYRIALGVAILLVGCTPQPPSDETTGGTSAVAATEQTVEPTTIAPDTIEPTTLDTAEITDVVNVQTTMGRFRIGLYGKDAPLTVANFLDLVKRRYYDGIQIHRISKEFVIQMGDPRTRDAAARAEWGRGGETASGEPLPEELDPDAPSSKAGYLKGVVAMARKPAPNTGTSQFFICLDSASRLPHQYTIFGRVIDGMDTIDEIAAVEVEPGLLGENDGIPRRSIAIRWIRKR